VVALAAYSCGQTFTVTPLELIRAQAATINGGYLYTPYLVEQVLDDEGNIPGMGSGTETPATQPFGAATDGSFKMELHGADATVGLFRQMLLGIRFNQRLSNLRRMDAQTPVLFIAGDKDPVGANGAGVRRTYQEFLRAGMQDCTLKLYPGLRHEILNEKGWQREIFRDIGLWLTAKL